MKEIQIPEKRISIVQIYRQYVHKMLQIYRQCMVRSSGIIRWWLYILPQRLLPGSLLDSLDFVSALLLPPLSPVAAWSAPLVKSLPEDLSCQFLIHALSEWRIDGPGTIRTI